MLSCEIILYTMLLQISFRKKATWRTARSITLAAHSANCLHVAAKTRTKTGPTPPSHGKRPNMTLTFFAFFFTRTRSCKHVGPRSHYRFVSCLGLLRSIPREKQVGSLILFSKPVPTIHGVFAPEVTVESLFHREGQGHPLHSKSIPRVGEVCLYFVLCSAS